MAASLRLNLGPGPSQTPGVLGLASSPVGPFGVRMWGMHGSRQHTLADRLRDTLSVETDVN